LVARKKRPRGGGMPQRIITKPSNHRAGKALEAAYLR
jgi:hypothetical protein